MLIVLKYVGRMHLPDVVVVGMAEVGGICAAGRRAAAGQRDGQGDGAGGQGEGRAAHGQPRFAGPLCSVSHALYQYSPYI
eukprot:COSAG05_NODE_1062_length_5993_cov_8.045640_4_plen_80_part_00